jgi:hypothetical protein
MSNVPYLDARSLVTHLHVVPTGVVRLASVQLARNAIAA